MVLSWKKHHWLEIIQVHCILVPFILFSLSLFFFSLCSFYLLDIFLKKVSHNIPHSFKVLQSFVADLCDKMTGISLYGVVTDIFRETKRKEVIFSLKIEDSTGAVWAKLHFSRSWYKQYYSLLNWTCSSMNCLSHAFMFTRSFGRLSIGHTVFIFGLSCYKRQNNRLVCLTIHFICIFG